MGIVVLVQDIVVVVIVAGEVMVVIIAEGEIMESATIVMIIKILDTNRQENLDLMATHHQILNANMKKKLFMLQKPSINLIRNVSPFFLPVVGRNMLLERESDLRKIVMNLA